MVFSIVDGKIIKRSILLAVNKVSLLCMNTAKEKQVIIIAGANGSGKTTFAKKYLETVEEKYEFLNADVTKRS